jgi:hypothetical protein
MYHCHSLIIPASAYLTPHFLVSFTIKEVHSAPILTVAIAIDHPFLCHQPSSSPLPLSSDRRVRTYRRRQRHSRDLRSSLVKLYFRLASLLPHQYLLDLLDISTFIFSIRVASISSASTQLGQPLYLSVSLALRPTMDAPLSSPSLSQPSQYFQGAPSTSASQSSSYTSQPAASANQAQAPSQQQTQTQRGVGDASPFLRDFNLVAEAAKRAQMAVLMRDMEAVGL